MRRNDDHDRYAERWEALARMGRRLDAEWDRLHAERERLERERERLRDMRARVSDFTPRDDDRARDRTWDDDGRNRCNRDIHLEPWRGPREGNRYRGPSWRAPERPDFYIRGSRR